MARPQKKMSKKKRVPSKIKTKIQIKSLKKVSKKSTPKKKQSAKKTKKKSTVKKVPQSKKIGSQSKETSLRPRFDRRHLNLGALPTLETQDATAQEIAKRLREALTPSRIHIQNESAKHAGHKAQGAHYRIMLVSEAFEGLSLLGRERWIQSLLEDLIKEKKIHALATDLKSPSEFTFENSDV